MMIRNETIVALATPLGNAPLAIIRVSGEQCFSLVESIFQSNSSIQKSLGNTILFGYIQSPVSKMIIDQVLISVFKNPKSFTGEDMIEITCHGGMIIFQQIIHLLIDQGCVMAQPGEFSQRAFFNHKMDLPQAESIHELIFSKSDKANALILNTLKKQFTSKLSEVKEKILHLAAKIEVGIDYPEEDLEIWESEDTHQLQQLILTIKQWIDQAQKAQMIYQGLTIAIVGKPNAGKSSLLNYLLGEEKAIVSPFQGTTRDPVEASLNIDQMPITFIDTAGIREKPENEIESLGIQKSQAILLSADFVLILQDTLDLEWEETKKIKTMLDEEHRHYIIIINKIDLQAPEKIPSFIDNYLSLSCKTGKGFENLLNLIKTKLPTLQSGDMQFFINMRQSLLLKDLYASLKEIETIIKIENMNEKLDIVSFQLQKSLKIIAETDGSQIHEDILETIFSHFCVGK